MYVCSKLTSACRACKPMMEECQDAMAAFTLLGMHKCVHGWFCVCVLSTQKQAHLQVQAECLTTKCSPTQVKGPL